MERGAPEQRAEREYREIYAQERTIMQIDKLGKSDISDKLPNQTIHVYIEHELA